MSPSHDTTIVLRLSQEMKQQLQDEAASLDVSLSELIRTKLLHAQQQVHREPVIRAGGQTLRLDEVLRPDVISYDYVDPEGDDEPSDPAERMIRVAERMAEAARKMMDSARRSRRINETMVEKQKLRTKEPWRGSEAILAVVELARSEARRLKCDWVGTEHLLLGLCVDDPHTAAARSLIERWSTLAEIRSAVEAGITERREVAPHISGDAATTRQAEKALKLCDFEAKLHHADQPASEHLLLALVRDDDFLAAQILAQFGIDHPGLDLEVNQSTARALGGTTFSMMYESRSEYDPNNPRNTLDEALKIARVHAVQRGSSIEPLHLLLGILDDRQSEGWKIIARLAGGDDAVNRLRRELLAEGSPLAHGIATGNVPLSKHAEAALRSGYADYQLRGSGDTETPGAFSDLSEVMRMGTEYLLLGILREAPEPLRQILHGHDVTVKGVQMVMKGWR